MLSDIATQLARIVLLIFIVLGTLGNCLNLWIFTRRTLYRSSCTLYLIAASIDNLFVIYTSLLTRLMADGFNFDPTSQSNIFCKIRYYIGYVFFALSPYFFILACFDRYCSSSTSATRRSWNQRHVAKRLIIGAIVLACIVYSHMAIFFQLQLVGTPSVYCYALAGFYSQFYAIFYLIVYCLLPSFFMSLFSLLTLINIRRQSRQVMPALVTRHGHRRLDRQLVRLLFAQVLTQIICILPFATINVLGIFISTQSDIVNFIDEIFRLPLFFSYASSFYIFTLSSRIYREELKKIAYCWKREQGEREFNMATVSTR